MGVVTVLYIPTPVRFPFASDEFDVNTHMLLMPNNATFVVDCPAMVTVARPQVQLAPKEAYAAMAGLRAHQDRISTFHSQSVNGA